MKGNRDCLVDYLSFPEPKVCKGIPPELHEALALESEKAGKSINAAASDEISEK